MGGVFPWLIKALAQDANVEGDAYAAAGAAAHAKRGANADARVVKGGQATKPCLVP